MSGCAVGARRARVRRQLGRHQRQVERRGPTDLRGQLDHARVAQEPARLFGAAAQVRARRGGQPRVELVEAAPGAHGRDRGGQLALRGRGVVHVVGGDAADVVARGQLGERVVAHRIERVAVIPQLHQHTVATEGVDQPLQLAGRRARALVAPALRARRPCGSR